MGYVTSENKHSDATQAIIDKEIKTILDQSYERVKNLLSTHSEQHNRLANELIIRESIVGEELENVILGRQKTPNLAV